MSSSLLTLVNRNYYVHVYVFYMLYTTWYAASCYLRVLISVIHIYIPEACLEANAGCKLSVRASIGKGVMDVNFREPHLPR